MKIERNFFERKTLIVAKELLGKYLIRNYKGKLLIGKIVETEAYIGPKDKASHAYSKKEQPEKEKLKVIKENWKRIKNYIDNKELFIRRILKLKKAKVTKRNLAEYLRGGHIYIYLVYGNYYQLNITTYKEGYPECVLIRSLEPVLNLKNPKGPGKLCEELKLDSSFWGEDLVVSKRIWLEDNISVDLFHKATQPLFAVRLARCASLAFANASSQTFPHSLPESRSPRLRTSRRNESRRRLETNKSIKSVPVGSFRRDDWRKPSPGCVASGDEPDGTLKYYQSRSPKPRNFRRNERREINIMNLTRRNKGKQNVRSSSRQSSQKFATNNNNVRISSRDGSQEFATKNIIVRTTRIGIDYAEEHKFLKWRFYLKNNKWVSKK